MQTELTFTDVSEETKEALEQYWSEKKERRFDHLLTRYPAEAQHCRVHTQHFAHHNAYRVTVHVQVSSGPVANAEHNSHDPHKALDLALDAAIQQVRHFLDRHKHSALPA